MFFFLPLGTTRPHWRFPAVTYILMALNVMVFVAQLALGGRMAEGFVPAHPGFTAWFLSLFMHGGVMHLAGNMLFLWLFGTVAEDVLGPKLFLAFYFGGAVGASALDWVMSGAMSAASLELPRVGASGAIAGIMGLSAVCFMRTRVKIWYLVGSFFYWRSGVTEMAAPVFLGLWVGWEIVSGLASTLVGQVGGVAHWAHVGGFLAGMAAAAAMGLNRRVAREDLITGRAGADESKGLLGGAAELEEYVRERPEDAEAWRALGLASEAVGRTERARECYQRAVLLFLQQARPEAAAEAYLALRDCPGAGPLATEYFFDLGAGMEAAGRYEEAYRMFRSFAAHHPDAPRADTALVRAGQVALSRLNDPARAAECYRTLLEERPDSQWRSLAQEKLAEVSAEPAPGAPEGLSPDGAPASIAGDGGDGA